MLCFWMVFEPITFMRLLRVNTVFFDEHPVYMIDYRFQFER